MMVFISRVFTDNDNAGGVSFVVELVHFALEDVRSDNHALREAHVLYRPPSKDDYDLFLRVYIQGHTVVSHYLI